MRAEIKRKKEFNLPQGKIQLPLKREKRSPQTQNVNNNNNNDHDEKTEKYYTHEGTN